MANITKISVEGYTYDSTTGIFQVTGDDGIDRSITYKQVADALCADSEGVIDPGEDDEITVDRWMEENDQTLEMYALLGVIIDKMEGGTRDADLNRGDFLPSLNLDEVLSKMADAIGSQPSYAQLSQQVRAARLKVEDATLQLSTAQKQLAA